MPLQPSDELLTPPSFFPHPLANGAFLLVRSTPKLLLAFNRSRNTRALLLDRTNRLFDEWDANGSGLIELAEMQKLLRRGAAAKSSITGMHRE